MNSVAQVGANTLATAALYLLVALGFLLPFRVGRFFHFAHGVSVAAGPYGALALTTWCGFPVAVAIPAAIGGCAILGCGLDRAIYRPLRNRASSSVVLLLASLGAYIALQNLLSMFFGDSARSIRWQGLDHGLNLLGARFTAVQVATVIVATAAFVLMRWFFESSRPGLSIRAVAGDPELARACGVNTDHVSLIAFGLGSALGGLAGILAALDIDMTPTMGLTPLMMGVVALIVGGERSLRGVALGSVVLALAQNVGSWFLHAQWGDAVAFLVLLGALLVKPRGLFGYGETSPAP